ncbi:MAG: glutamyl-tRNA reductase [Flavobacteriales bacterium]|nr:glutamyl-tRNA reductase [Flavobacteriales bacterium]
MVHFGLISFQHKSLPVAEIGRLHITDERLPEALGIFRSLTGAKEVVILSTCNRVEFHYYAVESLCIQEVLSALYPGMNSGQKDLLSEKALILKGGEAVRHIFEMTASLHSAVVGEREILGQFRDANSKAQKLGYRGDYLRILERKAVEIAKRILTETPITDRPVSIVNLAAYEIKKYCPNPDARILMVGSGKSNTALSVKLKKFGYRNFSLFNRTPANGAEISNITNVEVLPLSSLSLHKKGFDVLVSCTSSDHEIISKELYQTLLAGQDDRKIVVDLAVPADIDSEIAFKFNAKPIDIAGLKKISEANLQVRKEALEQCRHILHEEFEDFKRRVKMRRLEVALQNVPTEVRSIRSKAVDEVFARDLQQLDDEAREVLDKVLSYMEKKFISKPMLLAREVFMKEVE